MAPKNHGSPGAHCRRGGGDARAYVTLRKLRGYRTGFKCVTNVESITQVHQKYAHPSRVWLASLLNQDISGFRGKKLLHWIRENSESRCDIWCGSNLRLLRG